VLKKINNKMEATQMIILTIGPKSSNIKNPTSSEGKSWSSILSAIKSQPGFQRLYWGLQVETPEKVQLHIGTDLFSSKVR